MSLETAEAQASELFEKEIRQTAFILIESNGALRRAMLKALKEAGATKSIEAASGKEGWMMIKSNQNIGVILCAGQLEDTEGLKVLQLVNQDKRLQNTTFVILSNEDSREHIAQAISAGVDGYIVKPFALADLKQKVEDAIAVRQRKLAFRDLHVALRVPVQITLGRQTVLGQCIDLARNECQILLENEVGVGTRLQLRLATEGKEAEEWYDPMPGAVSSVGRGEKGKFLAKISFTAKTTKSQGILALIQQHAPK